MAEPVTAGSKSSGSIEDSPLRGSLPLLILTSLLFLGAFVLLAVEPRMGAGRFPLWSLLFTLGIVAAIGTTISWFYASEQEEADAGPPVPAAPFAARRTDFGRPSPEVGARPNPIRTVRAIGAEKTAPWDEDVLPPVVPRGPRPVLTTLDDPGEIGRALEEIAEIQRQLAARPATGAGGTTASARA